MLFVLFLLARRIVHSPFGLSLRAIEDNPLRAAAIGIPVNRRLVAIYTLAAFYAGIAGALLDPDDRVRLARRVRLRPLGRPDAGAVIGGTGYLYGGLIGAVVFKLLQDLFSSHDAAILAVLDRPDAGGHRAGRPRARCTLGAVAADAGRSRLIGGRKADRRRPESDAP